jgi:integrase
MAGSRPLTEDEQRLLVRRSRRLGPRDRALICAQLFLGFRISEILSLTVGHVVYRGQIARRVSLPPRFLKGGYGGTRSVPMGPELTRALENYLRTRGELPALTAAEPLFLSRHHAPGGGGKPLCRSSAEKIIKRALLGVSPDDPAGLSTHSLRKSWATRLYEQSGHDLLCVRDGLGTPPWP